MYNPRTGDGRITGSTASLLGLEKGMKTQDEDLISASIDKILLLYGIVLSYGGIPMLYAGDEVGAINDYSYLNEKDKRDDSRWLNRPMHPWESSAAINQKGSIQARIYQSLKHMIALRKKNSVLADQSPAILHSPNNSHILVFERKLNSDKSILVVCNFDENEQVIDSGWIEKMGYVNNGTISDLISSEDRKLSSGLLKLRPFEILWLQSS